MLVVSLIISKSHVAQWQADSGEESENIMLWILMMFPSLASLAELDSSQVRTFSFLRVDWLTLSLSAQISDLDNKHVYKSPDITRWKSCALVLFNAIVQNSFTYLK